MGSGKLIKIAIEKYGLENFQKDILGIFLTNDEAASLEKDLVTKELVSSGDCYNMHIGGHGGFDHINNIEPEFRPNVIAFKAKIASGEISCGGDKSEFFTEETIQKLKIASAKGNEVLKNRSQEEKAITNKKISISLTGNVNTIGRRLCVEENSLDISNRKYFLVIPDGWITTEEWKHRKKNKTL